MQLFASSLPLRLKQMIYLFSDVIKIKRGIWLSLVITCPLCVGGYTTSTRSTSCDSAGDTDTWKGWGEPSGTSSPWQGTAVRMPASIHLQCVASTTSPPPVLERSWNTPARSEDYQQRHTQTQSDRLCHNLSCLDSKMISNSDFVPWLNDLMQIYYRNTGSNQLHVLINSLEI